MNKFPACRGLSPAVQKASPLEQLVVLKGSACSDIDLITGLSKSVSNRGEYSLGQADENIAIRY